MVNSTRNYLLAPWSHPLRRNFDKPLEYSHFLRSHLDHQHASQSFPFNSAPVSGALGTVSTWHYIAWWYQSIKPSDHRPHPRTRFFFL